MHKVIFVGNSEFGVPAIRAIHASPHRVACVVTREDRPRGRGKKLSPTPVAEAAERLGLHAVRVERPGRARGLCEGHRPDFLVVCDYGDMIPRSLMRVPRHGCLNIHPSLLPRWRGAAPIERAILAGDKETGVSIMLMDTGLDSGPVLLREAMPVEDRTSGDLRADLAQVGAALVVRALDEFESLEQTRQDETQVTWAGKITEADEVIDWRADCALVERQVRALQPSPGARTALRGATIKVGEALALPDRAGEPGTVAEAQDARIIVGCGAGSLAIRNLQKAGGRMMGAREFLNGFRLEAGARFESPGSSVDRANPS